MNSEFKKTRELRFVCPECGSNSLRAWTSGMLEILHVYDNGVFTWGDMHPEELGEYECGGCRYSIARGECKDIVEWLIAHCKQDESEEGRSPEDKSGAGRADER